MKLDDLGAWISLTVVFFLVLATLTFLLRFWNECRADVAQARGRRS